MGKLSGDCSCSNTQRVGNLSDTESQRQILFMQSFPRFDFRRSREWTRKCVLPWLIPTYLFIGSFAAHAIIDLFENHLSFTRHVTDDLDGSNDNGIRPYWASHKHVPSDDRMLTDTVTLADEVDIDPDREIHPALLLPVFPPASAQIARFCIERAPPMNTFSYSALVV